METDVKYIFNNLIDFAMVVGPSLSFYIQIFKIKKYKSSEGFSKLLTLILLAANIIRIFYWLGKDFSKILLYQSIIMILTQLFLLYMCIIYSNEFIIMQKKHKKNNNLFISFKLKPPSFNLLINKFWRWSFFTDYLYFLIILCIILVLLTNSIGDTSKIYFEILGIFSAGIESLIGIPQMIHNFKTKKTGSLSVLMILAWLFGDSFKTFYFVINDQPMQFVCCGLFQIFVDVLIIFQILFYGNNDILYASINKSIDVYDNILNNEVNFNKKNYQELNISDDLKIKNVNVLLNKDDVINNIV